MVKFGIGQPVQRVEDQRFLTGAGRYTDDVNLPRQAYAYFLRSSHANAKLKKVDTRAAAQAPGVLGVFTGADLVTAVEQSPPDVIVLRHERPGTQTGLALVARLKTVAPGTAIVLTTSELTPDAIDKNKIGRAHV